LTGTLVAHRGESYDAPLLFRKYHNLETALWHVMISLS